MLSERQQIALKLVGLIAITGLMGLGLYLLFFTKSPSIAPPNPDDEPTGSPGLPTAGTGVPGSGNPDGTTPDPTPGGLPASPVADGGLTQTTILTTSGVMQPTITSNGTVAYYDPRDGKFYTINDEGEVELLTTATFPSAQSIVFATDASAAVIEFPDGSNVVYDFESGAQTTMPSHWEDFSFTADGNTLATKSIGNDPSNRSLVVTAADGSSTQVIAALGNNDDEVIVDWSPTGEIVGFSKTGNAGSAFGQNEIYLLGADGEAAGVLIVNGTNFSGLWSPDGANLLYSVADAGDDYRASLWYGDSQGDRAGDTRLRLSLKTTADKCTFASSTLAYCAVPATMPAGGGSAPSLVTAPDSVYSISFPSGRSTLVAIPDVNTQMSNLSVSEDGNQLYYTDAAGRLGFIQLD
jgi:hypothetical protein